MAPKLSAKKYKEEKEKEKKDKKDKNKKNKSNKVGAQLNPHCSKCPHKPPQSLTLKDNRKLQKGSSYSKLYKIT